MKRIKTGSSRLQMGALFSVGAVLGALLVVPSLIGNREAAGVSSSRVQSADAGLRGVDGVPPFLIREGDPCADPVEVPAEELITESTVEVVLPEEDSTQIAPTDAEFCNGGSLSLPVLTYTVSDLVALSGPEQRQSLKKIDPDTEVWVFYEDGYPEHGRKAWLMGLTKQSGGQYRAVKGAPAHSEPASADPSVRNEVIVTIPGTDRIVRIQSPWTVSPDQLWMFARALPIAG